MGGVRGAPAGALCALTSVRARVSDCDSVIHAMSDVTRGERKRLEVNMLYKIRTAFYCVGIPMP